MICTGEDGKDRTVRSVFQVTEVTRPLWSIPKLLDNQPDGAEVVFRKNEAFTRDANGKILASAVRKPNGLFVSNFQLANPRHPGFARPAQR